MAKTIRKYLIAGNWKMNKTASEGVDLINEIKLGVGPKTDVGVAICPPFTALESCAKAIEDSNLHLGAQNMHPKLEGAYTGEVSPVMLRSMFCTYVILGHSERREYFNESDAFINEKVLAALDSSLKPIFCVGETLEQREAEETFTVIRTQLVDGLKDVTAEAADSLVIAYEPVWAIGTGKTATPEMAQEVHKFIRDELKVLFGAVASEKVRILYGGSMKPENASELLDQADIDGGLIGGAALKSKSFLGLIEIAHSK
jgi:triosephosphate isomerase